MLPLKFSIIIPVYNRPGELDELLESLAAQTYKDFEVIVVEDGSDIKSEAITGKYSEKLNIHYYYKDNEGPGLTRNYGALRAAGNYFIFFDSDCLIPERYMEIVHNALTQHWLDAYGGPDAAHKSFTPIQKAISYSMTSFLTTGGIRGGRIRNGKFHPRSFNMGFSKNVFLKTGGFARMRFGEDLDLSMRIKEEGSRVGLIRDALVYHKRRTDFWKFFKQVHNSGIARINLYKRHPGTLKAMHFVPAAFVVFSALSILLLLFKIWIPVAILIVYFIALFIDSWRTYNDAKIALLSVEAAIVQHTAYGTGFIKSLWKRVILGQPEFDAFRENLYK
jgi:glycosyltransferase involved in cell wall biosynthesis